MTRPSGPAEEMRVRRKASKLAVGIAVAVAAIGTTVVVAVAAPDEPDPSAAGIVVPPPGTTEETQPSRTPVEIPALQPTPTVPASTPQPPPSTPSQTTPSTGSTPPAARRFDPSVPFRIVNQVNSLVLDSGGDVEPGTPMKLWKPNSSSTNLQFRLIETGNGYYRLTNRTNSLSVDGRGATNAGSLVGQRTFDGATAMQWLPVEINPGRYLLKNRATGLVLNGTGPGADAGDRAEQWPAIGSPNLLWRIVPA